MELKVTKVAITAERRYTLASRRIPDLDSLGV